MSIILSVVSKAILHLNNIDLLYIAWYDFTKTAMKNSKVAYNKSLLRLLETSNNVIIRGIYLSHFPLQSGIWDWWSDTLSP